MINLTENEKKAIRDAVVALRLAIREEWQQAAATIQQISNEFGVEGIDIALLTWCDMVGHKLGISGDAPIRLMFMNFETGETGTADQVPAERAWAGRLITARMARDRETYEALINALPDDPKAIGDHVLAVLTSVAVTLTHPQPDLP